MKLGLLALLLWSVVPVSAHESRRGYTTQRNCYKESYREVYVAGRRESKGYVKSFLDRVEVPCSLLAKKAHYLPYQHSIPSYNNARTPYYHPTTHRVSRSRPSSSACRSSRATSGLLGGGLAAAVSKKDAWGWAIPLGAVFGLGVGDANC